MHGRESRPEKLHTNALFSVIINFDGYVLQVRALDYVFGSLPLFNKYTLTVTVTVTVKKNEGMRFVVM